MDIYRNLIFFLGRIKYIKSPPFFTWDDTERAIDYNESSYALSLVKPGDIGLHRDDGFLSNWGIPGAFKHSWIFWKENQVIEANQHGVLKRHAIHPLHTDYAIILRPHDVSQEDIDIALDTANSIVGCEYDHQFRADNLSKARYVKSNGKRRLMSKFYCHEVTAFSWWHKKDQLGLHRDKYAGKNVFLGDSFITCNFDIVWVSRQISSAWCEKKGMNAKGVQKIEEFLRKNHFKDLVK